jgi:hypothetical protein
VTSVLATAKRSWLAKGASAASLAGVKVVFADLPGRLLALTAGKVITLDRNAAGWGWSFGNPPKRGRSCAGASTVGRIDMLAVLEHELGHVLGLGHADTGVMRASLAPGGRCVVPKPGQVKTTANAAKSSGRPRAALPRRRAGV